MDSSPAKTLWDGLMPQQKKEMAAVAARWRADRHPEDVDVPVEDVVDDDPTLPTSSSSVATPSFSAVPPSPVHYTMTIGKVHARYMDMVREDRFWEA
ncbi:hypothetical protein D1007_48424 [Hordeum vulgare]|nr:hypothetical protein D1007_48424 [Hordeum vulgare]